MLTKKVHTKIIMTQTDLAHPSYMRKKNQNREGREVNRKAGSMLHQWTAGLSDKTNIKRDIFNHPSP